MTSLRLPRPARWLLALALLAGAGRLRADDEYQKIIYWQIGDPAPAFELKDDQGNIWTSSRHYGKKYVVIYFYMGDFMKNCTKEACAYRDQWAALADQGAEVVGISGDSAAGHRLFKAKYHLKQTLLADDKGDVGKAWGLAWSGGGEWDVTDDAGKTVTLTRGVTESRWTWVVDEDGKVIYKNTSVNADEDARQVLTFLTELNARRQPQQP